MDWGRVCVATDVDGLTGGCVGEGCLTVVGASDCACGLGPVWDEIVDVPEEVLLIEPVPVEVVC